MKATKKVCKPIFQGWFVNNTDGSLETIKVRSNNLINARKLVLQKFEESFNYLDFTLSNVVQLTLG